MQKRVRFATGNAHKISEAKSALRRVYPDLYVLAVADSDPREIGTSFLENALIKARAGFEVTGETCFADDSGICVDVMGGSPGIFSAIWSGGRSDEANRQLLLAQLTDISAPHRSASFVCTIALASHEGEASFTGVWNGSILQEARGGHGFGYDPVFLPEYFEFSAAEIDPDLKDMISHRAQALGQLAEFLKANPDFL